MVGGGQVAYRKIEVLQQFDAKIIVVAPDICENIIQHSKEQAEIGKRPITLKHQEFMEQDMEEADIIIAATNDQTLNSYISRLGKKNNKLVNVVDVKEECSFIVPAIIKQGDLIVAISTGGNSPAMATKIKENIQNVLPNYYEKLIEQFGEYRDFIKDNITQPEERKKAYYEMISLAEEKKDILNIDEMNNMIEKYKIN